MTAVTLLCLVLALLTWLPPSPASRRRRLAEVEPKAHRWRVGRWLPILPIGAGIVAGCLLAGVGGAVIGFSAALVVVTVAVVVVRQRRSGRRHRRTAEVVDACQELASLLRVGHVPAVALDIAAADAPLLAEAAAARRSGGDVVSAFRRAGAAPGAAGLTELAIAWQVAEQTGASLTATLDALADRMAATRKVLDVVNAELAAPRATGRVLAALPLVGLVLGYTFGGDPVAFLVDSLAGQCVLGAGVTLACAGVLWTERLADAGDR